MALQAENKLALTGTPYVNKPADLYSLFAFLDMPPLSDKQLFKTMVADPITNRREIGLARLRTVMSHLALRRTKAILTDTIKLPPKHVVVRQCEWEGEGFHGATHEHLYQMARASYSALLQLKAQKQLDKGSFMQFISLVQKVRQVRISAACIVSLFRGSIGFYCCLFYHTNSPIRFAGLLPRRIGFR